MTQPLLQNRGRYVNRIGVMQAESSYKQAGFSLRSQLLNLVNTAEGAYWNLVQARESLRVAKKAQDNTQTNYEFILKQLSFFALTISNASEILGDCNLGDSISVNGTWLTVTSFDNVLLQSRRST